MATLLIGSILSLFKFIFATINIINLQVCQVIMPTTIEILDKLKQHPKKALNKKIKDSLKKIKQICENKYWDQSFYGNTALNRQMILDHEIAKLLTPDVLVFIFTNDPSPDTQIKRDNCDDKIINLKDAIYQGFKEGLHVIRKMPNNEFEYGPKDYELQQRKFTKNTMQIVDNISIAADVKEKESEQALNFNGLIEQYEQLVQTVNLLKKQGQSDQLLLVPGYTSDSMRRQVVAGFNTLCQITKTENLHTETLDSFCEKFLKNPEAMLHGCVIHLFYDRAHIEAALEQDTEYKFKDGSYNFQQIFRKMIQKVATNPHNYPVCAIEQFCLRFGLVESDLQKRFEITYQQALQNNKKESIVDIPPSSGSYNPIDNLSNRIDKILNEFEKEIESVGRYHSHAKTKAQGLLKTLKDYKMEAFKDASIKSLEFFSEHSKQAIKDAIPELQRDLGWGHYLLNMGKQLANEVTTCIARICSGNKSQHKGFFTPKRSEAVKKTEALKQALESELPSKKP